MQAPFCTVDEDSEVAARLAGARQLGVAPEDVAVTALPNGSFRVEVVRAPFAIEVAIAPDGMEASFALVRPSLGDAPPPTVEDLLAALRGAGVTVGILGEELARMLELVAGRGLEQRDVVVARGRRPVRGESARLVRHVAPPAEAGPAGARVLVRDGQLLLERVPATAGEPGTTVTGEKIAPPADDDPPVPVGPGIVADEGEETWRAAVPGFGFLEHDERGVPRVVPAITVAPDRLSADLDLRGAGGATPPPTRAELGAALAAAGVAHGLLTGRVDKLWRAFERGRVPRRPIRVAGGTPPRHGRDAGLELAVTIGTRPGRIDARTGRIDFRERGSFASASAGQLVGTWRPATRGVDGVGVDGSALPATPGRDAAPTLGAQVTASENEDGSLSIRAAVEGVVVQPAPDHVDVVDLLDLAGDVDYSTGNVDVQGCVVVKGTVRSGFRVTAKHDVAIGGAVEDAEVAAGGTLSIGQGIFGGPSGRISAAARMRTRFAQNANIRCGGDFELGDSCTNSVVECGGKLLATEGRGKVQGGSYTVTAGVVVKELGSTLGVRTTVRVGTDPELERVLRQLEEALERTVARRRKLQRDLGGGSGARAGGDLSREKALAARRLAKQRRELTQAETALRTRKRLLEEALFSAEPLAVDVLDRVHAGVEITICGTAADVKESARGVRYQYDPRRRRIEIEEP